MSSSQLVTIVRPGNIDRATVRQFVAEYTAQLEAASMRGENVHQMSLDQQDKVEKMTSEWNEVDQALFAKLYTEELTAYSNAAFDKANQINAQTAQVHMQAAKNVSNVATWVSLIVFFVFLIFMIKVVRG